jgi:hypothetical protein
MKEMRIAPSFIASITSSAGRLDREHHVGVADQFLAVGDEDDVLERGVGQ